MSDKENFAKLIIDAWQNGMQNTIKDKQFTDLIVDNYSKFQDLIKATTNENFTSTNNGNASNATSELGELRDLLASIEQRISKLEKHIGGSTEPKSPKPKKPRRRN